MKNPFKPGDVRIFRHIVSAEDAPGFNGEVVHPVYATYALARDVEWAGRQFILEMKDEDEEGIGTALSIRHVSPAMVGNEVIITSKYGELMKNELITPFEVKVGERMIADGETRQKIVKKEKLAKIFLAL